MIKKLKKICLGLYRFTLSQLLILFGRYERKYCTGRYFSKRHFGIFSVGWHWMVNDWRACRKCGVNANVPWPVSSATRVVCPENISFHPDDLNNFQTFGIYYQAIGKITIGRGSYIAPNVGLITANHDPADLDSHLEPKPITLGEKCWIGMNAVVLPGVTLGPETVVGAGSVVTKSFPEGHCVIAGNPARKLRDLSVSNSPVEKDV